MTTTRTQVGIIGAGPAGLLLSHILHLHGIDSVIVENRSRAAIEQTIRAGVLEQGTIDLLRELDVAGRIATVGAYHHGFDLRWRGATHRVDMQALTGRSIAVYPQHEVLIDLIARRLATGADIRFEVSDTQIHDFDSTSPAISFTDATGAARRIACDFIAGCDGSWGVGRKTLPDAKHFLRVYPFAWFGILCHAPVSNDAILYARSQAGFALISTRTDNVQRMYFQCDPAENPDDWSDERIWTQLQACVAGPDGYRLHEGPVFQKSVIPLRSFVCEPMQHGRLFLAGDAAHLVPPTGAKGLNLAANDVVLLARGIESFYHKNDRAKLDSYTPDALRRIWRAQHFSWWMTSMLHNAPEHNEFDARRSEAELDFVTTDRNAETALASVYAGAPLGE